MAARCLEQAPLVKISQRGETLVGPLSASLAFVYHNIVAAAIAPDPQQGMLVFGILSQLNCLIRVSNRMAIDLFDDVSRFQAGVGSS
jgi:hypothetical protein